jgi:hypothetical protein
MPHSPFRIYNQNHLIISTISLKKFNAEKIKISWKKGTEDGYVYEGDNNN